MRRLLFVAIAMSSFFVSGQDQPTQAPDSIPLELQKKIFMYNASRSYNDALVNRVSLYLLLAENPSNYALRDSLALLYLQQQEFASAALVAQEVADLVPEDMFATQIAANALERLGVKDRALGYYERLSLNDSDNLNFLYKIGFLQYDLKLYEEAITTGKRLSEKEEAKNINLVFPTADEQGQEASLRLAAIRLMGMVEELRDDKVKAKEYYEMVLTEMPNFEVVKQQLEGLNN